MVRLGYAMRAVGQSRQLTHTGAEAYNNSMRIAPELTGADNK